MMTLSNIHVQLQHIFWKTALKPYCKTVRAAAAAALGKQNAQLTIVLADDAFVQSLNHEFRGKNKPTNVLSFSGDDDYLGDVILAFETIKREALDQKKTFRDHTAHLIVHGVLHLLGHDHDHEKKAEKMERLEIKILKKLGITNPYLC
ncbi:MAG: rRNA maturation RNase YbeY [Rickettsiales bacterium]|nr:rRNA maturation RNase YbeY [Rickettsiales bacterium]